MTLAVARKSTNRRTTSTDYADHTDSEGNMRLPFLNLCNLRNLRINGLCSHSANVLAQVIDQTLNVSFETIVAQLVVLAKSQLA